MLLLIIMALLVKLGIIHVIFELEKIFGKELMIAKLVKLNSMNRKY